MMTTTLCFGLIMNGTLLWKRKEDGFLSSMGRGNRRPLLKGIFVGGTKPTGLHIPSANASERGMIRVAMVAELTEPYARLLSRMVEQLLRGTPFPGRLRRLLGRRTAPGFSSSPSPAPSQPPEIFTT
ncbi:unnamed protein product [Victoria cruziana]